MIEHHIKLFKSFFKINSYWGVIPSIFIIGKLGVILFFVLSGFLITYLLLSEEYIKISLENSLFNYFGRISYGLYMFHPKGIILSLNIALAINLTTNWLLYPLNIMLTIIIAAISYIYYESIFLRFKVNFAKIVSGDK